MKKSVLVKSSLLAVSALFVFGFARRSAMIQEFSISDPKGANGFAFSLTDGLEPVHGTGNDVSGTVMFNVNEPAKSTGKLVIGIKSLKLTNDQMTANMKQSWCLDAEKYPTASFEVESGKLDKKDKNGVMHGTAVGTFTIRGVSKKITVHGTARFVKGGVKARFGDKEGDLMMLQTEFDFNRFDYGIGKDFADTLIANRVHVQINCAAMAFAKSK
jgi:polyisoprenoid-binding protein YceI